MGRSENDVINTYLKKDEEKMLYICHDVKDKNDDRIAYYDKEMDKRGWKVKSKKLLADVFGVTLDCHVTYVREINKEGDDIVSEYKPFLEIIKDMKDGDVAICANKKVANIIKKGCYFYMIDSLGNERKIELSHYWFEESYKVKPRYVSFDEAKKAVDEGKTVEWVFNGKTIAKINSYSNFNTMIEKNDRLGKVGFRGLFEGMFLIK